jgi:hypothetical protein
MSVRERFLIVLAALGFRFLARVARMAAPARRRDRYPVPEEAVRRQEVVLTHPRDPHRTMHDRVREQAGPKSYASGKTGPILWDDRNIWFLGLLATFSAITAAAIVFLRHEPSVEMLLSPLWLALLALASYRLGRIMALDEVTQPFRMFFVEVKEIDGIKVEVAKEHGLLGAVGALITSPGSIGFWIAGIFTYLFVLWPTGMRMIIIVLAVNGLGEMFNALVNLLARKSH